MTKPAQIMIVEDELVLAKYLGEVVESLGYTVAGSASSGEEAIEKAGDARPDLVLMDIVLEGAMDGVEAAGQIHERFGIPVVYVTQHMDDGILQRARATEPCGFIIKPFEERALCVAIELVLCKRRFPWLIS